MKELPKEAYIRMYKFDMGRREKESIGLYRKKTVLFIYPLIWGYNQMLRSKA